MMMMMMMMMMIIIIIIIIPESRVIKTKHFNKIALLSQHNIIFAFYVLFQKYPN